MSKSKSKIFISAPFQTKKESDLITTLNRAGFETFQDLNSSSLDDFICSVHFLDRINNEGSAISKSENDFLLAQKTVQEKNGFKSFFWLPDVSNDANHENTFIDKIQNSLGNQMILSTVPHTVQFVEDLITVLEEQNLVKYDVTPSEIFLICSESDQNEAAKIQLILSDIVSLVKLIIVQDTGLDYEEMAAQQLAVSKVCVIYYKKAKDWAIPFTQQIWKKVGGAGSGTPILLVGDTETNQTTDNTFEAPKVTNMVLPLELIPLEVKVQYDLVNESK